MDKISYVILEKSVRVKSHPSKSRLGKIFVVKEHQRKGEHSSEELAAQNVPTRDVLSSVCSPTRAGEMSNVEYKYNPSMVSYCKKLRGRIEKHLLMIGTKRKDIDSMYKLINFWNGGHTSSEFIIYRRIFSRLGEVADGKIKLSKLINEEIISEYKFRKDKAIEYNWGKYPAKAAKVLNKEFKEVSKKVTSLISEPLVPIYKEIRTISRVLYEKLYNGNGVLYRGISDSVENKRYVKNVFDKISRSRWESKPTKIELEVRGGVSFTPHKNIGKFFAQYNKIKDGDRAVISKKILPGQVEMFWPVLNGELNNVVDTREVIVRFSGNKITLTKDEVS